MPDKSPEEWLETDVTAAYDALQADKTQTVTLEDLKRQISKLRTSE